jgi:hypothetical protein
VNTPNSDEVKHLKHNFQNLIEFTVNLEKQLEKKRYQECFALEFNADKDLERWIKTSHKQVANSSLEDRSVSNQASDSTTNSDVNVIKLKGWTMFSGLAIGAVAVNENAQNNKNWMHAALATVCVSSGIYLYK